MAINIDTLSEAELIDLNQRIVERLKFMQHARAHRAMLEFRIGERVWFENDLGGRVDAMIVRYNRKSVSLMTDEGQQWRVAPRFLRKVQDDVIDGTAENIVLLPE